MISLFTTQPDCVDGHDRRSFVRRRAIFIVLAWLLATVLNLILAHYLLPIALADSQLSSFRLFKWQFLGLVWLGSLLNVWRSAITDLLRLAVANKSHLG